MTAFGPGLGWWSDIFELILDLNTTATCNRHAFLFSHQAPLFNTHGHLSGTVAIIPSALVVNPPSQADTQSSSSLKDTPKKEMKVLDGEAPVWQYGLVLQMETTLSFGEALSTDSFITIEKEIYPAGYISKKTEIKFDIDLNEYFVQNKEKSKIKAIVETYDGDLFSVTHMLMITVKRPWYTFDVMLPRFVNFQDVVPGKELTKYLTSALEGEKINWIKRLEDIEIVKKVNNIVLEQKQRQVKAKSSDELNQDEEIVEAPLNNIIHVNDFAHGDLELTYNRVCFEVGECFEAKLNMGLEVDFDALNSKKGTKSLSGKIRALVPRVALMLYKVESGDDLENEVVIKEKLFDLDEVQQQLEDFVTLNMTADANVKQTQPESEPHSPVHMLKDSDENVPAKTNTSGKQIIGFQKLLKMNLNEFPEKDETKLQKAEAESANEEFNVNKPSCSMTPTFVEVLADNVLSVRYFLRLMILDVTSDKEYWNTNELILYRSKLLGNPAAVKDLTNAV